MEIRLKNANIRFERPCAQIARYKMLKHNSSSSNPKRYELLKKAKERYKIDGLSNVNVQYKLVKIIRFKLYTHLFVNVNKNIQWSLISTMTQSSLSNQSIIKPSIYYIIDFIIVNIKYEVNYLYMFGFNFDTLKQT